MEIKGTIDQRHTRIVAAMRERDASRLPKITHHIGRERVGSAVLPDNAAPVGSPTADHSAQASASNALARGDNG